MGSLKQTPLTCSGHTRPVVDLCFSGITPKGYFLISASKDGLPMLRQGETGDWIGTFQGHKGAVWGATLSRDSTKAATAAADFTAKYWNAVTGDVLHSFTHKHIVKSVDFNESADKLLTGSNEKCLKIFDLQNYDAEPTIISGHQSHIKSALFVSDGKKIVSASEDKTVRVWDIASNEEVQSLHFTASPRSLELSADKSILLITYGHSVSFWDIDTLMKKKEFEVPTEVNSASLQPNKSTFVCGGDDFKMYKYDYDTGMEMECFKGHFGPIHCVRFSPDGEVYASGSEDGTLRLWQNVIGKSYGLWKCISTEDTTAAQQPTTPNAANDASANGQTVAVEA